MTTNQMATYKAALKEARGSFEKSRVRLDEITAEAEDLRDDMNRLKRTITALASLCSEDPMMDGLGITEAVMEVMQSVNYTMTTADVIRNLEQKGFDLGPQKNANASVHAVLSRLSYRKTIVRIDDDDSKTISWRGPNYDPKADEIPF